MTGVPAMLHGDTVYRIHWVLGTDRLLGVCHCGAEHESEDPVELWDWLLAHPEGHEQGTAANGVPPVREFAGV
ncbi:hypothetical protein ABZ639_23040 [Saccharomonospora sp. NPDC006951]